VFEARVLAAEYSVAPVFSCKVCRSGHRREKAFAEESHIIQTILLRAPKVPCAIQGDQSFFFSIFRFRVMSLRLSKLETV